MPDKVVFFELPADDVDRAKIFYQKAFGWQINYNQGLDYHLVATAKSDQYGRAAEPGAINGGMPKRKAPAKSTTITIDVTDIDSSLKSVEKLGGKILQKKSPVGDIGFSAYFEDTEGNRVGLFQSTRHT